MKYSLLPKTPKQEWRCLWSVCLCQLVCSLNCSCLGTEDLNDSRCSPLPLQHRPVALPRTSQYLHRLGSTGFGSSHHLDCPGRFNLKKININLFFYLQGTFLANNSDPSTITRNSGVFWAMNMSSSFIGNTLAFFLFKDEESISKDTKDVLAWILTAVSGAGILLMFTLRPTPWSDKPKVSMVETLKVSAGSDNQD